MNADSIKIKHLPSCKPEHMTEPDEEEIRDCLNCGLWEHVEVVSCSVQSARREAVAR